MEVNKWDMYTDDFHKSIKLYKLNEVSNFLPIIPIYYDTTDYPGKYVARLFVIDKATTLMSVADTKEELLKAIPKYMTRMNRSLGDDAKILEIWL